MRKLLSFAISVACFLVCSAASHAANPPAGDSLKLVVQNGYLPQVPALVRVEVLNASGSRDRELWDAEAILTADAGVSLSTNKISLRNGLGSGLVSFSGGGNFTLTATVGSLATNRSLVTFAALPVASIGGTLPGSSTTWSNVIRITNDLTVPVGHTLTLLSNTLVLVNGVASGSGGPKIIVNGTLNSLGTEARPVTITCSNTTQRWGQIQHNNAQPSLYQWTSITRAGLSTGEGHTGQTPVIRPNNSTLVFRSCAITDHADGDSTSGSFGTPGKVMYAIGSALTFDDCILGRSRMGPEIQGTALFCTNTWIMDMKGPDDSDGIYLHDQSAGQNITLADCVVAFGDDDGIDTLSADVNVERCIIRNWPNPNEDAKGISAFSRTVTVRRCLITDCWVGVSAKTTAGASATVNIQNSTIIGISNTIGAQFKANAPGPIIDFRITNSILWGIDALKTDFGPTNFTIGYCDIAEAWPGTGNLSSDPLFVSEASKNYHLLTGSPAINSGDPSSPLDPDSSRADIGVFPFDVASAQGLFVNLTAPANGSTFTGPTNLTLDASASSTTGSVARVEFFQGTTKLGEDTASPYSLPWNNVPPGIYALTAVATDTTGFAATSAPVNITINNSAAPSTNTLIALGSTWKYLDDGSDQGANWSQRTFNDTGWSNGVAALGYCGGGCAYALATSNLRFGPDPNNKYTNTYFRKTFTVADPSRVAGLIVNLLRDDGAVVYINGVEGFRVNMPGGPITSITPASSASNYSFERSNVAPAAVAALVPGSNVLGIEVHQGSPNSSDIALEAELLGVINASTNVAPVVSLTAPPAGSTFAAPASVVLTALASDGDGTITNVAFYANGSKIADDASNPYSTPWNGVPAGNYALTAVATDNTGLSTTSSVVNVTVSTNTAPPIVFAKTPAPDSVSTLTQISVTFSKPVLGVNASDLLVAGVAATGVTGSGSNYTFTFPQPPYGTVAITWATGHGIVDVFTPPAAFNTNSTGANWQYQLLDAAPPTLASVTPVPGTSVPALTNISLLFSEPVSGVNASDLRINANGATSLSGSGAGPYIFGFAQPALGVVQITWNPAHGIQDSSGNPFSAAPWSYTLDTNVTGVVISEIMYHPSSENVLEEYIELFNKGAAAVNMNGWRFSGGVQFTFTNVSIPAGGFLVVAADTNVFKAKYAGVNNVVGNWTGFLNNSGEDIDLDDAQGNRADSVEYADEGDWAVRQRGPNDLNHRGWIWFKEHDGFGKSLELINPSLSNNDGQNWAASRVTQGTPGSVNSVFTNNVAPMILEVAHFPVVPKSSEQVLITTRVVNETRGGLAVTLSYRADAATPPAFTHATMRDDGTGGDAAAGDGIYAALIPAHPNNTVVEFYVSATDPQGLLRTWPAPAIASADGGVGPAGQVANALYQVDDTAYNPTNNQPLYKLVMTENERAELQGIPCSGDQNTDAQMNGTFISVDSGGTEVRYLAGFRNRGHGSRCASPPNYRVAFRSDERWKGVTALNLNSVNTYVQHFGSVAARKAGVTGSSTLAVQLRVNNVNRANSGAPMFGSYAAVEALNGDWSAGHFPLDPNGNVYRVIRDLPPPDFSYRGETPASYQNTWFKESNESENDWTDLIGMLRVAGINNATSFTTENVRQVINVEQWLRHLAVMNFFGNAESGLNTGYNDDYYMYRGISDPRFILSFHDLDSILGVSSLAANSSIFTATANLGSGQAMDRLMNWPDFQPLYFQILTELANTTFSSTSFDPLADATLGGYVTPSAISGIKAWMAQRRASVLSQIPSFTVSNAPVATLTGSPRSPTPITSATLTVGGSGVVSYRFKLNAGAYGAETPVGTPINLSSLANGMNTVSVIGRNALGLWQDITNATVLSWMVNTAWPSVRLNEVLARNDSAFNHSGTFPDVIELFNEGAGNVDLSGLRLTDDLGSPNKFAFPAGTTLAAGTRLFVLANNPDGTGGLHTGFSLNQDGDAVYLLDRAASGNTVLDSVVFGLQLPNLSIGRITGGDWTLNQVTIGAANTAATLGDPRNLKINEWQALGISPTPDDFIELFNPNAQPVALGGLALTDQPIGAPALSVITPLSFIAAGGYAVFIADGNPGQGANHVTFGLALEQGEIGLMAADKSVIDSVIYGPQQAGISSGLCPDGSFNQKSLVLPTPGAPNACPFTPPAPQTVTLIPIDNIWSYEQSGADLGTSWRSNSFNDAPWPTGAAVLAREDPGVTPEPIRTVLTTGVNKITFYFRTHFNVPPTLNVSALSASHLTDDGAVFYINGAEAGRFNLPPPPTVITNGTTTPGSHEANIYEVISLPTTNLLSGDNVLAVEVHQQGATSSDVVFGLKLDAIIVTNSPAAAGVLINEVLANNATLEEPDGSKPDWVEIYNPSSNAVDLAGMSLTDTTLTPQRWVFPPGAILPALGYYKVRLDPDLPASTTNAGFGLKANGGAVYLFNRPADGGGPASSITYGLQAADYSIGRVPSGSTNWVLNLPTMGLANIAASLGNPLLLKVNEWMAAPLSGDDWMELYNPNAQPVNLSGLWLSDSVTTPKYQIPVRSYIGTGPEGFQRFWAANGTDADFTSFSLNAGAEAVALFNTNGAFLHGFSWNFPQLAGVSEGLLPDGSANRVFFTTTATPGKPNFLPLPSIVINELLSHTDPPLEDAVELLNVSGDDVDISGWYLSDSQNNLLKYRIPANTIVRAGGFRVFYEYQFNLDNPDIPFSFSSAKGDEVYLSQSTSPGTVTGYRAFAEFGASENGVSFGRYQTSLGFDFTAMSARTFGKDNPATTNEFRQGSGTNNAYPKVGPIVINEIMYNYPGDTNDLLEFVELHNILGTPAPLYDPTNTANVWRLRKGVDFDFPPDTTIPAGGYVVVVNFNPQTDPVALAGFRATYGTNMTLFGPYSGKLDNGGEAVELQKPDAPQSAPGPDFGLVPYITVDRVVYADTAPWPTGADGGGQSLKRITASLYGNDPVNWTGGAPTPGAANSSGGPLNTPPVLGAIGNKSVTEGVLLSFNTSATDTDAPPQTLTFSLDPGAPAGASITPAGAFTWAPSEAQGPGVYAITVRVTDSGAPVLSDFETINVTVAETNAAPVLTPIGNKVGNEGSLITFTADAVDTDEPTQTLTYTLDPGFPSGAGITSAGVFTWTPTEAQGPGSYSITVRVTDSGTPARTDSETIQVTVNEANTPPVLASIGNKTVSEGAQLSFTATAADSDLPAQSLTYTLDAGAPAGASINANNGAFTWTPTTAQGPSNYTVTIRVTDNGSPALNDFETININVTENLIQTTLVGFTNAWKYLGTGTNLGTAWVAGDYDDASWPSARAVFFNESTATTVIPAPTNTFLPLTGPGGRFVTNFYFRTKFILPADPSGVTLTASNVLDDGAVIYINGVEAQRINMTNGAFSATTFALRSWEATSVYVTNLSAASLIAGENVLAVEVHQQSATSSDMVFGLSLSALVPSQTPVAITSQPTNLTVTTGSPAQFSVGATGSAPQYQWLKNGTPITGARSATYSIVSAQAGDAGTYSVVVSNLISSETSSSVALTVNPPANSPPVLASIGNKAASEGTQLGFTATATDPESPPQTLTFTLDAGAPAGAGITTAGVFTWTPTEAQGGSNYSVTIRVRDNGSPQLEDFETITITVNEVNVAPVLGSIGNKAVTRGRHLSFTATASDADVPAQSLAFSLDAGAPAGATIDTSSGLFSWTPPAGSAPATNQVTVRVTDNGSPALNDFETIQIVTLAEPRVAITRETGTSVRIQWDSYPGKTYRVEQRLSLSSGTWTPLGNDIPATGISTSTVDPMGANQQRFYRVMLVN